MTTTSTAGPSTREHDGLGELAGRRAGSALAGLAASRSIGVSRMLVPDAPPLVRFAAATATGDFAATYLALARGIDPSAPRLGELAHIERHRWFAGGAGRACSPTWASR